MPYIFRKLFSHATFALLKWQKSVSQRPKWSTQTTFLTPHLVIPKDIATKRGEDRCGTPLYHHANFNTDRCHRG